jgi:hypothetical protein
MLIVHISAIFIQSHVPGKLNFDFHTYMMRALEHDFKRVVGIRLVSSEKSFELANIYKEPHISYFHAAGTCGFLSSSSCY